MQPRRVWSIGARLLFPLLTLTTSSALAWKPVSHIALADLVLSDASDGQIELYETNFETGGLKRGASGAPILIGRYNVRPDLAAALRQFPAQYHAGVFGPDAYPDIATGQQLIHPAGTVTPGETNVDINRGGPGSNPWLEHLWRKAFDGTNPNTPTAQKAFVAGYLTHAAQDMFAHTLINYYTGGAFHFTGPSGAPAPENAVKHILLEGYLAKRGPAPANWNASIAGIDGFIFDNLVFARRGTDLERANLLSGELTRYSIPSLFSRLYNQLQADIDQYSAAVQNYDRRIREKQEAADRCAPLDFTCSAVALRAEAAALGIQRTGYVTVNGPINLYKEHWRDDVRDGLRALPDMSHRLAIALFFTPPKPGEQFSEMDTDAAKAIINDYALRHLTSMAGAPDFLGLTVLQVQGIVDAVLNALGVPALKEAVDAIQDDAVDYLLRATFGIPLEDVKAYLKSPELQFSGILNSPAFNTEGTGHLISLQNFNAQELHLQDPGYQNPAERYDVSRFPAAHNSVVMAKLLLLPPGEVNRLMRDVLGRAPAGPEMLTRPNIMLGYIETLDGKEQWHINPAKMVVASNCAA